MLLTGHQPLEDETELLAVNRRRRECAWLPLLTASEVVKPEAQKQKSSYGNKVLMKDRYMHVRGEVR